MQNEEETVVDEHFDLQDPYSTCRASLFCRLEVIALISEIKIRCPVSYKKGFHHSTNDSCKIKRGITF